MKQLVYPGDVEVQDLRRASIGRSQLRDLARAAAELRSGHGLRRGRGEGRLGGLRQGKIGAAARDASGRSDRTLESHASRDSRCGHRARRASRRQRHRVRARGDPRLGAAVQHLSGVLPLVGRAARAVLAFAVGVRRRAGERRAASACWSTASACPARAGSPTRGSTSPRTCCAGATTRPRSCSGARTRSSGALSLRRALRRGVAPGAGAARGGRRAPATASPATCPTCPRRVIGDARRRQPRRDLVLLLARLRRAGRARPLRPDRAEGAVRRRRLLLQRQDHRRARHACAEIVARPADASSASSSCPTSREQPRRSRHPERASRWRDFMAPYRAAATSRSRACRSTTRSTSCTRPARPACPSASCTAPAARCCST